MGSFSFFFFFSPPSFKQANKPEKLPQTKTTDKSNILLECISEKGMAYSWDGKNVNFKQEQYWISKAGRVFFHSSWDKDLSLVCQAWLCKETSNFTSEIAYLQNLVWYPDFKIVKSLTALWSCLPELRLRL